VIKAALDRVRDGIEEQTGHGEQHRDEQPHGQAHRQQAAQRRRRAGQPPGPAG
jgi:hypothetical protein